MSEAVDGTAAEVKAAITSFGHDDDVEVVKAIVAIEVAPFERYFRRIASNPNIRACFHCARGRRGSGIPVVGETSPYRSLTQPPPASGSKRVMACSRQPSLSLRGKTARVNNAVMHRTVAIALAFAFFVPTAMAVRELVVIEEPQLAQKVEGIVLDGNGDPIPDMTVTDRTEKGEAVLRSTKTDGRGHFHFPTQRGKTVYCLRFDHPLWNPLQLTVKVDKHAPHRGITAKPEIGG